tara:strand:+ start:305 stop:445 length:141 start_codon:yes stop_codon:yes gene_type:complete
MKTIKNTKEYYQRELEKQNKLILDLKAKLTPKELKDLIARIELSLA